MAIIKEIKVVLTLSVNHGTKYDYHVPTLRRFKNVAFIAAVQDTVNNLVGYLVKTTVTNQYDVVTISVEGIDIEIEAVEIEESLHEFLESIGV